MILWAWIRHFHACCSELHETGLRAPRQAHEPPFFLAKGTALFEWLRENTLSREGVFDSFMRPRRKQVLASHEVFPITEQIFGWSSLRSRCCTHSSMWAGVAAGISSDSKEQYPSLPGRLILQDLPETRESLGGEPGTVEPMAYDFYTPQPVKGVLTMLTITATS